MKTEILIAGGGIGGLAAALALAQGGHGVRLLEQSSVFGEVGAGIQMGPNVVRVLRGWGVEDAVRAVAAYPRQLTVRNALSGQVLASMPLNPDFASRYGADYATIARADLHALLLAAVQHTGASLHLETQVLSASQDEAGVQVDTALENYRAQALVAADGVWSRLRSQVVQDGPPRVTGHLAFRALVAQDALPLHLRSHDVTAWLGPDFHAVQYPVRRGELLNVVAVVRGEVSGDPRHWDHSANAAELRTRLARAGAALQDLVRAIDYWRLWALSDRPPMASAAEHARGRIALLGDAAHPMRPYLAQGAGMAMEDAHALAGSLAQSADIAAALRRYAEVRWQRNARVQARSIRNGEIFHLQGPLQLGRDLSLRLLGQKLLDVPWLYAGA